VEKALSDLDLNPERRSSFILLRDNV